MLKFLVVTVLVILAIVMLMGVSVLKFFFRAIFGGNRTRQQTKASSKASQNTDNSSSRKHKKIFSSDEGEYVDYEEVTDNSYSSKR